MVTTAASSPDGGAADGRLPASALLQGRRGVGKQRLALWLGQYLLCDRAMREHLPEPCGNCQHCRYAERAMHPDLHWFFPRPRLKDGDASTDDVKADLAEAITERMEAEGLWGPTPGTEGLYVATVRALVHMAAVRPAMAARQVFVVGDAERMVSQEGADQAANAFLKLLEEPPAGTTLLLTTSEPGLCCPPSSRGWSRCVYLRSHRRTCRPFSTMRWSNGNSHGHRGRNCWRAPMGRPVNCWPVIP